MKFRIKRNDTRPALTVKLLSGGVPIDLTGAQVKFLMKLPTAPTAKISRAAGIIDAVGGIVSYVWQGTDTDTSENYLAEWQITFGDGSIETVPNDSYDSIQVWDDLG